MQYRDVLPNPLIISEFWEGVRDRFPNLATIASHVIWMPVASVDVERGFLQYKHILNDRRESLTKGRIQKEWSCCITMETLRDISKVHIPVHVFVFIFM